MFDSNNWIVLAVTILIMIVQEVIMPRLKIRFCIYILPTVSFIAGIIFTIFSQNSLLTKVIMAAAVMLLSIIILLMGETASNARRKKRQEQYSKDEFYNKK